MGVGSFKGIQKLTNKVNTEVGKVMTSKIAQSIFGGASQILRRFPTPADVANLPDPLKSSQWEALFPSIPIAIGTSNVTEKDVDGKETTNVEHVEKLPYVPICENISFTIPKLEAVKVKLGPSSIYMASCSETPCTFSADFYCDNNATIISYYEAWKRLAVKSDQLIGFPNEYKKRVYLYLLGARSVIPAYLIKFKGVFPSHINQISMSSDNKVKRITATITFYCDNITTEPLMTGQMFTGLTNNIVGNALTQFGSVSVLGSHKYI